MSWVRSRTLIHEIESLLRMKVLTHLSVLAIAVSLIIGVQDKSLATQKYSHEPQITLVCRLGVGVMSVSSVHPYCCRGDWRRVWSTYGGRGPRHLPPTTKDGHLYVAVAGQGEIPQRG